MWVNFLLDDRLLSIGFSLPLAVLYENLPPEVEG
jgi:hypothetical protein